MLFSTHRVIDLLLLVDTALQFFVMVQVRATPTATTL
jgi:hypothetical protein